MIPSIQLAAAGGTVTTTTSFQDIPNLSFFVSAGGMYRVHAYFIYQGSTTAAQLAPALNGTCTPSLIVWRHSTQSNSTTGASATQVHRALAAGTGGNAVSTATTDFGVVIDGLIVVSTSGAGTLTVAVKHAGAACTITAGGRYILEQLD